MNAASLELPDGWSSFVHDRSSAPAKPLQRNVKPVSNQSFAGVRLLAAGGAMAASALFFAANFPALGRPDAAERGAPLPQGHFGEPSLDLAVFDAADMGMSVGVEASDFLWLSDFELALADLGRIEDGWDGEGSLAPLATVIKDIEVASSVLDSVYKAPEFEVDSGDGTVTLVWTKGSETFSLVFLGNGRVTGIVSPYRQGREAWTVPVQDDVLLSEKLDSNAVAEFLET